MTALSFASTLTVPQIVLDLLPEVSASPTPVARRVVAHSGLQRVMFALGAESYALLRFASDGRFRAELGYRFAARELGTVPSGDAHLLLRRLAASRGPLAVSRNDAGPAATTLDELGISWIVAVPARSATRSRGVLLLVGRSPLPPPRAQLSALAALSGTLASILGPRQDEAPLPTQDPMRALRLASTRLHWRSRWLGWVRRLLHWGAS